jgi:hypothetical protein
MKAKTALAMRLARHACSAVIGYPLCTITTEANPISICSKAPDEGQFFLFKAAG